MIMERKVKKLEFNAPTISYKRDPLDVFVHIDFIQRWFNVLDVEKLREKGAHTNVVYGKDGKVYTFREAFLTGFKGIFNNDYRMLVQDDSGNLWVLKKDWVKTFQQISVSNVKKYNVKTYQDILFLMSEFYLDKDFYERAVNKILTEVNKTL